MSLKKRRLGDLYKRGTTLQVGDGDEADVVEVWLQKMNPLDHETTLRKANAARARIMMIRNNVESEEYLAVYSDVCDFGGRENLINYLVQDALGEKAQSIEAELAAEEVWSEDDLLQGLRDAWAGGLADKYADTAAGDESERDPDAVRVFKKLKEFADQVDKALEAESASLTRDYESTSLEELRTIVTRRFIESRANAAWLDEFQSWQLYFGVREPDDHKKRYFEERYEIDELEPEVRRRLREAYEELMVDPTEGKDSPQTTASSASSEQPEVAATDAPSGPMAAAQ